MPEERDEFGGIISAPAAEQPERDEFGGLIEKAAPAEEAPTRYPRGYEEPSDEEAAKMFGQKPQGFFRGAAKGFQHPFESAAKGVGIPFLEDDTLKEHLTRMKQEQEGGLLPPTTAGKVGEVVGGLAGVVTQAGLTHLAAGRGGPLASKAALAATFGSSTAYDEFVRAGTNALREGKDPDEALAIAKKSATIAAPLGGALGIVTPPGGGSGLKKALVASGVLGAAGAALPLAENIVQRAQGLKTPLGENVLESGGTMAAVPLGLYGLGKALPLVPRAVQALRGKPGAEAPAQAPAPGEPPPLPAAPRPARARPAIVETESFAFGEPVEIIEANPAKGVALVRMPDGTTRTVTAEQLTTRRKGEPDALQEQEAGETVRGVPGQPGQGQGQLPAGQSAQRVPRRGIPAPAEAAGSEVSLKLRDEAVKVAEQLQAAKARGAPAETQMDLEMRLMELTEKAEATMNVDDLTSLELSLGRLERPAKPPAKPAKPLTGVLDDAEQQALDAAAAEANEAGLPADLKYEGPEDPDAPFAVGRIATTDAEGNTVINPRELRLWLDGVAPERRARAVKSLITEEGIHSLARGMFRDEQLARLWKGLTGVERGLVRKSYTGSFKGKGPEGQTFTDAQMGHEYLRRTMQRMLRGDLTERAEGEFSQAVIDMIERVIVAVRKTVRRASPELAAMVNQLESTIAARRRPTTPVEGEAPAAFRRRRMIENEASQEDIVLSFWARTMMALKDPEVQKAVRDITGESHAEYFRMGPEGPHASIVQVLYEALDPEFAGTMERDLLDAMGKANPRFQKELDYFARLENDWKPTDDSFPAAFRRGRRPPPQDQESLNLLPPTGEPAATAAEVVRPMNPDRIAQAIEANVSEPRPSFNELMKGLKLDAPDIQPGQVKEAWRDAVWNKLMSAPGKDLAKLRDQLGLREKVTTGDIADPRPVKGPAAAPPERLFLEVQDVAERQRLLDRQQRQQRMARARMQAAQTASEAGGSPAQQARNNAIARIGERLIREADRGETLALQRKTVTPDEVGWWREKEGQEPALRRVSAEESRNVENLGRILTSGAAMDRTKRGGKRFPDTATKRLTVLVDNQTGEVHKVGTYRTKEGVYIVDPTSPGGAGVSLASLLARKAGGKPRYKPVYSVLLDEPVKGFRQRYPAWNRFREGFLDDAEREATRRRESGSEAAVLKGATEELTAERKKALGITEGPEHPGMMLAGDRLTRREADALMSHLQDEAMDVESLQDVRDAISSLTQKAENRTLKGRDWQVINALRKEVLKTERNNPRLKGTNEAVDQTIQRIFDEVQASKSGQDFANRLGAIAETVPGSPETQPVPGPGARELALPEGQPAAARATRAYHTRIGRYGRFPGQGEAPQAFRRPRPELLLRDAFGALGAAGDYYGQWMIPRLVRAATINGGAITRAIGRQLNRAVDRQKELYGDLTQWLDPAKRAAGRLNQTTKWANDTTPIPGTRVAVSNFHRAMEGKVRAPGYADQAMALWQQANFYIAEMLEAVIPGFRASGAVQRNLTAAGMEIIRRGEGRAFEDLVQGIAAANGRSIQSVRTFLARWKEALDNAAQDPAAAERVNQDYVRQFPEVVTHVLLDTPAGGRWEPVVHSTPFAYLESAARRAAHVRAFREEFPVNPASGRNPTWQAAYQAMQREIPSTFHGDLEAVARALGGHPTDSYHNFFSGLLPADSSIGTSFRLLNHTLGNLWSKLVLTGQVPTQIPESLSGATPLFLGARNYAEGVGRYLKDLATTKQLYAQMEQDGQVNRLIYDWSFNPTAPGRSLARIAGNAIAVGSRQNWLNEWQEAFAAATARVVRERIEAGTLTRWERARLGQTFRAMEFTRAEAQQMLAGTNPELLAQFERRAASWLTSGNKSIAEGSRLGGNRLFNSIFRFQSYPMMKMNQLRRSYRQMAETFQDRNATSEEKAAAARLFGRFIVGTGAQGMLMAGVTSLFYNSIFGVNVTSNQAKDEPGKFLAESALAATGGPLYLLWRGAMQSGSMNAGEMVARTAMPYSMFTSLWDLATGKGAYKDTAEEDRVGIFLERQVPGTRMIRTGLGMFGLGQKNEKLKVSLRAFYKWRGEELGWSKTETQLKIDKSEEFRTEMKRAVEALQKGDRQGYRNALRDAGKEYRAAQKAGAKTQLSPQQAIARSLRARRVLEDAEGRPLDRRELQLLRKRIGEDAFRQLRHYDLMLNAAADGLQLQPLP